MPNVTRVTRLQASPAQVLRATAGTIMPPLLRIDDTSLVEYVRALGLFPEGEPLEVEPAGDGNINYVRRVRAPGRGSVVIKHARATLERFPTYEAPPDRLLFEHAYGEVVRDLAPSEVEVLPRTIRFDRESNVFQCFIRSRSYLERSLQFT